MLRHKSIDRICCVVLVLTLLVSVMFVGAAAGGLIPEETAIGYEARLFDPSKVHTIDIIMEDWEAFLDAATSEEYSSCHLVIDGERYRNVAIRGKGNTSLSSVASYGNDRYSFKVEFDHYQTGSTYHGLDKLSLNNMIYDNTYMKDYFAYTMMNRMGVAAPLCSFVQINVNGAPWGLYLAVEGVEDAFLQRNYGRDYGELYKPDSMSFGGGRGNGAAFDMKALMEKIGVSPADSENGAAEGFTIPSDVQLPEDFDLSQILDSFGGSAGQHAAPSESAVPVTPVPAPTVGPTDNGSSGASSGMPASGETPEGLDPAQGMGSSGESSGMSAGTPAPTATEMPAMIAPPADASAMPDSMSTGFDPGRMTRGGAERSERGGFGGGFGMGSSDVKLQYIDDEPSSYTNIFSNAKTEITSADQTRLITSLKALSKGDTSAIDTEAVLRYMAVHNFLCNDDSYTGTIVHNYYLYEEAGVLSMIPWDYNLAYGGHSMGMGGGSDPSSIVNRDIDTLVSNGENGDRPMADWITASEETMAQYHAIYKEFMADVFESGWFEAEIDRVMTMISPYVATDPTAFCTFETFLNGAETLRDFCLKRAQSVAGQLNGDDSFVDASELSLSAMGTMSGMGGFGGDRGGFEWKNQDFSSAGMEPSSAVFPDEAEKMETPDLEQPTAVPNDSSGSSGSSGGTSAATAAATLTPAADQQEVPARSHFSQGDGSPVEGITRQENSAKGWTWVMLCIVLLSAAMVFVSFFRSNR